MRQIQTCASVSTAASECYCMSCRWNDRAFSNPTTCHHHHDHHYSACTISA